MVRLRMRRWARGLVGWPVVTVPRMSDTGKTADPGSGRRPAAGQADEVVGLGVRHVPVEVGQHRQAQRDDDQYAHRQPAQQAAATEPGRLRPPDHRLLVELPAALPSAGNQRGPTVPGETHAFEEPHRTGVLGHGLQVAPG